MSDLRKLISQTPGFELLGYLGVNKKWYVAAKSPWDLYSTTAEGDTPEKAIKELNKRLRLIKKVKLEELKVRNALKQPPRYKK